jgi:hypothetical protein
MRLPQHHTVALDVFAHKHKVIANNWGAAEYSNFSIAHGHPTVLSVDSWWYLPPYVNLPQLEKITA